jgi:hypothetical protein
MASEIQEAQGVWILQGGGQPCLDPAAAMAAGSIGLASFFFIFFKSINGGLQLNVTAFVN